MNDRDIDYEELAAFLDGRMNERDREAMLLRLAESDEEREILVNTASMLHQLDEEDAAAAAQATEPVVERESEYAAAAGEVIAPVAAHERDDAPAVVIPIDTRRRTRAPLRRWVPIAAMLAGVALMTGRVLTTRASIGGEPVRLAEQLERGGEGLPAGWIEQRPWASVRGEGSATTPSPAERSARSARAGAMLVDLSVALRAGDSTATHELARQLAARFDPRGAPLRDIAAGAGGSPERLRPLVEDATERIAERLDEDALRLGAWTEAAGLAAASRDAGFFRDRATRRTLDRAEWLAESDPPAHAAVGEVRRLLATDPPRWDTLVPALDVLARELANE